MSQQDECEDDIWDYKPLRKKKLKKGTGEGPATTADGPPATSKRRKNVNNNDSKKRKSVKNNDSGSSGKRFPAVRPSKAVQVNTELTSGSVNISNGWTGEASAGSSQPEGGAHDQPAPPGSGGDRWCPVCQMPFSILVVQTQRWHVTECLDAPREEHGKECPDGFQCTSTIPGHYRRYAHTLLAHSRASGAWETPAESSLLGALSGPPAAGLDSSQESAVSLSSQSDPGTSAVGSGLPAMPTKVVANGLLWLRSPTKADFKKRKGWSSTRGTNKSVSSSQEGKSEVSATPPPRGGSQASQDASVKTEAVVKTDFSSQEAVVKTDFSSQEAVVKTEFSSQEAVVKTEFSPQEALIKTEVSPHEALIKTEVSSQEALIKTEVSPQEALVKTEVSPQEALVKTDFSPQGGFIKADFSPDGDDDEISYSPLSKFPEEEEDEGDEVAGGSPPRSVTEREADSDSLMLFSDDDELFAACLDDDLEAGSGEQGASAFPDNSQPYTQVDPGTSAGPGNQGPDSAAAVHPPSSSGEKSQTQGNKAGGSGCLQSPQSQVLERLRQTLSGSIEVPRGVLDEPDAASPHRGLSSSQSSLSQASQSSVTTAPRAGQSKAGQAVGLKQTDIGVFFGLKPLKEKEKEEKAESASQSSPSAESSWRKRGERRGRQRRSGAVTSDLTPSPSTGGAGGGGGGGDPGTTGDSQAARAEGGAGRGGRPAAGRKRWSRWGRGGEPGESRHCPFYKKIPGTKFVVDAFNYGEIEGISAYFLTHFHSDHYGGLRKSSTVPIYCNRITGNLVLSKLKVAEQYVHILPMNSQVTVDGVRVTLLDANHCPGSAMLLFLLPDGQTVLHTGDFRADPSMEKYPEILSCRVQTLYLDTTYCSPEYTFPTQDQVISFAANTAFETVTLAPRTLVVCGSYSVGKEKVFLALAEVLGSRVCLSRDKYNTMCCLESDRIRHLITTDWKAAQVHVLPMMKINFKHLKEYLSRFSSQYDQLLAFKPTGWTFSGQGDNVEDIRPQSSGNITIYGIPYSEHSSFVEMKRFVQWLQPLKVIPTVNVGSYAGRRAMEKCFSEWLKEAKTTR